MRRALSKDTKETSPPNQLIIPTPTPPPRRSSTASTATPPINRKSSLATPPPGQRLSTNGNGLPTSDRLRQYLTKMEARMKPTDYSNSTENDHDNDHDSTSISTSSSAANYHAKHDLDRDSIYSRLESCLVDANEALVDEYSLISVIKALINSLSDVALNKYGSERNNRKRKDVKRFFTVKHELVDKLEKIDVNLYQNRYYKNNYEALIKKNKSLINELNLLKALSFNSKQIIENEFKKMKAESDALNEKIIQQNLIIKELIDGFSSLQTYQSYYENGDSMM
jgi:hypothetical protein